jgi:short-subunit dehydrogenase
MYKNQLDKEVVLITGGCGRIGSALAENLLLSGCKVLIGDINKNNLIKISKKLDSSNLAMFAGDLTTKKNIDRFISFGLKKFKKIDSLIHCSYPKSKKWGASFEKINADSLKEDLYNQLGATIILSQSIIKYFLKKQSGNLILFSSGNCCLIINFFIFTKLFIKLGSSELAIYKLLFISFFNSKIGVKICIYGKSLSLIVSIENSDISVNFLVIYNSIN